MARSTFDLDVRGLLGAEEQLALLNLPPQLRRRLLNNVSKRVRSLSRQRIRNQQNLDGSPFEGRKGSGKGKKKSDGDDPFEEGGILKTTGGTKSNPF